MKVAWLTARKIDEDLCATTQLALANGLVEMGINLVMYSPVTSPVHLFNMYKLAVQRL